MHAYRDLFLSILLEHRTIYPFNEKQKNLYRCALDNHFFTPKSTEEVQRYQQAFAPVLSDFSAKSSYFMREVLQFIPQEERVGFIDSVFVSPDREKVKGIKEVHELLLTPQEKEERDRFEASVAALIKASVRASSSSSSSEFRSEWDGIDMTGY